MVDVNVRVVVSAVLMLSLPGLNLATSVKMYAGSPSESVPVVASEPVNAYDSNGVAGVGAVGTEENELLLPCEIVADVGIVPNQRA